MSAERAASARPGERELFAPEVIALGDEVAALRADPGTVVIPVDSVITPSMLHIVAVNAIGEVRLATVVP